MADLYEEMEKQETPEAKLYKALDKLEAIIQHNESPIDTWSENEYELNKTYAYDVVEHSDWLKGLRDEILKDTLEKIEKEKPDSGELLENIDRIHSTEMGIERIRKNLKLGEVDVIAWCKEKISDPDAVIERQGKNWYVKKDGCEMAVNAKSYTIITAHKRKAE
jgi:putative hydrolase of HD superfamily